MSSHVIDYIVLGDNFSTAQMRDIWSEDNRLKQQAKVEVALAISQGELGIIPKAIADAISQKVNPMMLDLNSIGREAKLMKHSLMATIKAIEAQCDDAGEFIHYGVTTQDIVDTATMIQLKEAFILIKNEVKKIIEALLHLSQIHQSTLMAGRTHGMQALPTTFGFKTAVWLDEFIRHHNRLTAIEARLLVGNISGAICTYASFGVKGPELEKLTLKKLGLNCPDIGWQSSRDRLSEFGSVCALISGTLGKIGNELYNLMRTEIGEIEEPFSHGKIGSTTMPHKRNPAALEGVASLTQPILTSVNLLFHSMHVEHERDAMSWRAEWIALPEICLYLSAQLSGAKSILANLTVNKQRMLSNLSIHSELLLSEKVMFELGQIMGKQTSHQLVYEIAMSAHEENRSFKSLLLDHPKIKQIVSKNQIEAWLNPENYLGCAIEKCQLIIIKAKGYLSDLEANNV